ncbi:MAG: hypothetical protein EOP10_13620 [Proteobacteria bacterium]|nr:MAG: hypothetical protein EOP10_13620 [Pseudomonadota bacterium]
MNILLWILQAVVAFFCLSGAGWRIANFAQASQDVPSIGALSYGTWIAIGVFEIVCALLLVLPRAFHFKPILTAFAASGLAVEMLLVTLLHARYFGASLQASNPGVWTFGLAILSAFIAYGRFKIRP